MLHSSLDDSAELVVCYGDEEAAPIVAHVAHCFVGDFGDAPHYVLRQKFLAPGSRDFVRALQEEVRRVRAALAPSATPFATAQGVRGANPEEVPMAPQPMARGASRRPELAEPEPKRRRLRAKTAPYTAGPGCAQSSAPAPASSATSDALATAGAWAAAAQSARRRPAGRSTRGVHFCPGPASGEPCEASETAKNERVQTKGLCI